MSPRLVWSVTDMGGRADQPSWRVAARDEEKEGAARGGEADECAKGQ